MEEHGRPLLFPRQQSDVVDDEDGGAVQVRSVVPKPLRDALGLQPGSEVEISRYGAGLQLIPAGRTAQVVLEGGVPVVTGDTKIDDEIVFALLDAGRR